MSIGKAVVICENIDSEKYSLEEKALAIREVMNMPTHMGVKKDTLFKRSNGYGTSTSRSAKAITESISLKSTHLTAD